MKKIIGFIILLSVILCSVAAHSQTVEETDPGFVLLDVLLYRPVGLVVTIVGTGVFIGLSPLTAFASIPEPHDAFAKTGKILILAPGAYTFIRPVGDRTFPYRTPSYRQKPVATYNNSETTGNAARPNQQQPLSPIVPNSQVPALRHSDAGF